MLLAAMFVSVPAAAAWNWTIPVMACNQPGPMNSINWNRQTNVLQAAIQSSYNEGLIPSGDVVRAELRKVEFPSGASTGIENSHDCVRFFEDEIEKLQPFVVGMSDVIGGILSNANDMVVVMPSSSLLESTQYPNLFGIVPSYTSAAEAVVAVCVRMQWGKLIFLTPTDDWASHIRLVLSFSPSCPLSESAI